MSPLPNVAQDAADKAVDRVISLLFGVDLASQESVNEFRADLAHVRRWRKLTEQIGGTAVAVIVASIVTGIVTLVIQGVNAVFGKQP